MARVTDIKRRMMLGTPHIHTAEASSSTAGIATYSSDMTAPVKSVEIPFAPAQDLNGYSNPWPGGGGKNLSGDLDMANDFKARYGSATVNQTEKTVTFSASAQATDNTKLFPAITFKDNTQYTFILTCSNSTIARTNLQIRYTDQTTTNFPDLNNTSGKNTVIAVSTANKTVRDVIIRNQGGSTVLYCAESGVFEGDISVAEFTPYANICPISGWTGCTVTGMGENLWDWKKTGQLLVDAGRTGIFDYENKTICWGATWGNTLISGIKWKEKTRYTFLMKVRRSTASVPNGQYGINSRIGYTDGTYTNLSYRTGDDPSEYYYTAIVSAADKTINRVWIVNSGGMIYLKYDESGIFEGVLTAEDFEPYHGLTLPLTFTDSSGNPLTLYGGTVTINGDGSADVVVTHQLYTVTNSTNVGGNSSGTLWINGLPMKSGYNDSDSKAVCNLFQKVNGNYTGRPGIRLGAGNATVYFYRMLEIDSSLTTVAAGKTWLVNNGCQFTYPLATPTTYHFSDLTQLKSWLGQNNMWCDISDDLTVKYWSH